MYIFIVSSLHRLSVVSHNKHSHIRTHIHSQPSLSSSLTYPRQSYPILSYPTLCYSKLPYPTLYYPILFYTALSLQLSYPPHSILHGPTSHHSTPQHATPQHYHFCHCSFEDSKKQRNVIWLRMTFLTPSHHHHRASHLITSHQSYHIISHYITLHHIRSYHITLPIYPFSIPSPSPCPYI